MFSKVIIWLVVATVFVECNYTQVELVLSARNLPSMDIFDGAPDPYVIISYFNSSSSPAINVGYTSKPSNTHNPDWPEVFSFVYKEGTYQKLKFDLWDDDIDSDDYMGYVEIQLSDVVTTFGNILEKDILANKGEGRLIIKAKINGTRTPDQDSI